MITCPKCFGESQIIETRTVYQHDSPVESKRRRRQCISCKERWTTMEVMAGYTLEDRSLIVSKFEELAVKLRDCQDILDKYTK